MKISFSDKYIFFKVLFLSLIVLFWRVIFSGGNFIFGDGLEIPFAEMVASGQAIKSGQLMLWSPYMLTGHPSFAGGHSGMLYPVDMAFFYLLPTHIAYNMSLFSHLMLAGIFTFFYCRKIGVSYYGASISGLSFTFCSFIVSHFQNLTRVRAAIWLPLIFLLMEKLFSHKNKIFFAVCIGFVFGVQLLSGHQPIALYSIIFAGMYFIIRIMYEKPFSLSMLGRLSGCFLLSVVVGGALSAIQSFPTYELLSYSGRYGGLAYEDVVDNSLFPGNIFTLVSPFFYDMRMESFDIQTRLYIGLIPFICVLLSFFQKNRFVWIHAVLICLSLFIAIGEYNPIFSSLSKIVVPITYLGRPYRFMLLAMLALSVLSGLGLDALIKSKLNKENKGLKVALLIIFLFFLGACFVARENLHLKNILGYDGVFRWAGVFCFFLIMCSKYKIKSKSKFDVYIQLLIFIVAVDLLAFSMRHLEVFRFFPKDQRYANYKPPVLDFLEKDGSNYRVFINRTQNEPGVNLLAITNNLRYNIASINGWSSLYVNWYQFYSGFNKAVVDQLSARYILSDVDLNLEGLDKVYDREIKVFENTNASPRALVVPKIRLLDSQVDLKNAIEKNEIDFSKYALLEEKSLHGQEYNLVSSDASVTHQTYTSVNVSAEGPGVLVLKDLFYPGWKAYVGGEETPVYRANGSFRAVLLGKGKHDVLFQYKPKSFCMGAMVSLLTIFFSCTVIIFERKVLIKHQKL